MECGAEVLVHHVQLLLAQNPGQCVIKTAADISNAFNAEAMCSLKSRSRFLVYFPNV